MSAAQEGLRSAATAAGGRGTGLELAAVLLLTVGSLFLPLVGWGAGVVLLWHSPLWRVREKLLGTLIWPGGPGGVLLLGGSLAAGLWLSPLGLWVGLVPPLVVPALLYRIARRRAVDQPRPPAPLRRWGALEVAGVALLGLGGLQLLPELPLVGLLLPLVGLLLVRASAAWSRRDKVVGALLVGLPLLLAVAGGSVAVRSGGVRFGVGPVELGLLGTYLARGAGAALAAAWFLARFRGRPDRAAV